MELFLFFLNYGKMEKGDELVWRNFLEPSLEKRL